MFRIVGLENNGGDQIIRQRSLNGLEHDGSICVIGKFFAPVALRCIGQGPEDAVVEGVCLWLVGGQNAHLEDLKDFGSRLFLCKTTEWKCYAQRETHKLVHPVLLN